MFNECRAVDNDYIWRLTSLDLGCLFLTATIGYMIKELILLNFGSTGMMGFAGMALSFVNGLGFLIVGFSISNRNKTMQAKQDDRYLILKMFSQDRLISPQFNQERFYSAMQDLLAEEIITAYGNYTDGRILYELTPKGQQNYQEYLKLEHQQLEKQMAWLHRKLSIHSIKEEEYLEVCTQLQLIRKEMIEPPAT